MSLSTVDMSCAMALILLAMDVARFAIASNVSCWRYPSLGVWWRFVWRYRRYRSLLPVCVSKKTLEM